MYIRQIKIQRKMRKIKKVRDINRKGERQGRKEKERETVKGENRREKIKKNQIGRSS